MYVQKNRILHGIDWILLTYHVCSHSSWSSYLELLSQEIQEHNIHPPRKICVNSMVRYNLFHSPAIKHSQFWDSYLVFPYIIIVAVSLSIAQKPPWPCVSEMLTTWRPSRLRTGDTMTRWLCWSQNEAPEGKWSAKHWMWLMNCGSPKCVIVGLH